MLKKAACCRRSCQVGQTAIQDIHQRPS